jgi:hypothetical protein
MSQSVARFLSIVSLMIAGLLASPSIGSAQWSWYYGSYPYSVGYYPYYSYYYPYSVGYYPSYTSYYYPYVQSAYYSVPVSGCCATPACSSCAVGGCGGCQSCGAGCCSGCGGGCGASCGVSAVPETAPLSRLAQRTSVRNHASLRVARAVQIAFTDRNARSVATRMRPRGVSRARALQDRPTWRLAGIGIAGRLIHEPVVPDIATIPARLKSQPIRSLEISAETQIARK